MKRAFSLLELLIVIAIIVVLSVLLVPAIGSMGRASSLNRAAELISGTLNLARQTAVTQNRSVEIRFYRLPADGQPAAAPADYRGMQVFLVDYDATNAISKAETFPTPAIVNTNSAASPLMDETAFPEQSAPAGITVAPVGSNYRYRSFRFKPDGATDLPFGGTNWSISIVNKNDPIKANNLPANFATISIEPMTGKIKVTRP